MKVARQIRFPKFGTHHRCQAGGEQRRRFARSPQWAREHMTGRPDQLRQRGIGARVGIEWCVILSTPPCAKIAPANWRPKIPGGPAMASKDDRHELGLGIALRPRTRQPIQASSSAGKSTSNDSMAS